MALPHSHLAQLTSETPKDVFLAMAFLPVTTASESPGIQYVMIFIIIYKYIYNVLTATTPQKPINLLEPPPVSRCPSNSAPPIWPDPISSLPDSKWHSFRSAGARPSTPSQYHVLWVGLSGARHGRADTSLLYKDNLSHHKSASRISLPRLRKVL